VEANPLDSQVLKVRFLDIERKKMLVPNHVAPGDAK
jgi:hypothetical protein